MNSITLPFTVTSRSLLTGHEWCADSGTTAETSVKTTNAGTHTAFIVAALLRAILEHNRKRENMEENHAFQVMWCESIAHYENEVGQCLPTLAGFLTFPQSSAHWGRSISRRTVPRSLNGSRAGGVRLARDGGLALAV